MSEDVLAVSDLAVGYRGGIDILQGIDMTVPAGGITAVIGPNGAGKSTFLKTIFGLLPPRRGSIAYHGRDISRWSSHDRKADGLAYLPQHNSTFPHLTIEENLRLGAWLLRRDRAVVRDRLAYVYELFPALASRRRERATTLSGGQLRMLSVAKEIVVPARLLLVDEPSVGMAPNVATVLYEQLGKLAESGVTILLVDQNLIEAVQMAGLVYLITDGRVTRTGTGAWFEANIASVIADMLHAGPVAGGAGAGRK
jgi:ABC-type branched-subunit amino acid transport system ATPase component